MKSMMPILVMMLLMLVALFFVYQGMSMHDQVVIEEAKFHKLNSEYWSQSKAVRDAALTDSDLNMKLVEIQNYPSTLLELKLIGVGKILTGIFVLLFGILLALMKMPQNLAMVMKKK
jgi:hypothetical protein